MRFVRYVGTTQCADSEYSDALNTTRDVLIDRYSSAPNSTVSFLLNGKPLAPGLRSSTLDFFDLAVLIYLADEMVERSKSPDYWTRAIDCLIPVENLTAWNGCTQLLRETLGVLAGDLWSFHWLSVKRRPGQRSHRTRLPSGFDTVCLFSGGTDSLLGAIRLLQEGRKVILVGHQAEGQTASTQTKLAEELRRKYPSQVCLVQCRVSRSLRENPMYRLAPKKEDSHRPRSFLFLALAVAIATRCQIQDVFMPENGFMALNIPLQRSRVGALSTRTAHPAFVALFRKLAAQACGFNGCIRNPFLTLSKTDMLRGLNPELDELVLRSISCARPSRYNNLGVRHCGYCVPCIHRRVALMEAGIDDAGKYAFDVFWNLAGMAPDKQQDLRAVARFAVRTAVASPTQLQALVLSQGYFPADVGGFIGVSPTTDYAPWTQMLQTWARDFCEKLNTNASSATLDTLGMPGN